MSIFASRAAWSTVLPAGALTFWPLIIKLTIAIVCLASFLVSFLENDIAPLL
jgi:hypothetical protein